MNDSHLEAELPGTLLHKHAASTGIVARALLLAAFALLLGVCASAFAQDAIVRDLPPGLHVPAAAQPGPGFDVDKATEAYLGLLTPQQRALSDAYFEGGYWLILWNALYGIGVMLLLLRSGASVRFRDLAERITRRRFLSTLAYGLMFIVAGFVLTLPLDIYQQFVREHQYDLSNLTFGGWLREDLIMLGVTVVIGAPVIALAYAGLRRAGTRWWIWGTGFVLVFTVFI